MADEGSAFGGITVATSIRYSTDKLRKLNNISYLFNPSWDGTGRIRVGANTLPMTLLFVTGYKELAQTEISSEQMILYKGEESSKNLMESKTTSDGETTTPQSVLNVVADNIVIKPRQWQVEAVLPDTYDALINSPFNAGNTFLNEPSLLYQGAGGDFATAFSVVPNIVLSSIGDVVAILSALVPFLDSQKWSPLIDPSRFAGDLVTSVAGQNTYNKDSLVDMWLSRAILKFKPPMEWSYKTVAITNLDISKRPNEDKCHRLSMTLQELPILTTGYYTGMIAGIKDESEMRGTSGTVKWIGDKLKKVLNGVGTEPGI